MTWWFHSGQIEPEVAENQTDNLLSDQRERLVPLHLVLFLARLYNINLLITNSMCKLCLHREPRSRLRRGERLRGGSTCQTSHSQKKTNGGIFVLLLLRSFVLKNENETLKPQFSHLGFFRRMSDRRLLSMRWRWEDETSKCNWKRISKLLLPWSRFLVNDEAQNDQCVLVIEPTFKVISKIQE